MSTTTDNLNFTASVELTAADSANTTPRVLVEAYTGGIMSPAGWGEAAVDLSGVELSAQIPILGDHLNAISGIVGYGSPVVRGGKLYVEGKLSSATEAGKIVLQLHRDGMAFQASIGMTPTKQRFLKPGETAEVNGRTLTASGRGLTIVQGGKLREVSIVALGADAQTSVSIAAKGTTQMSSPHQTPEAIEASQEKLRLEGKRVAEIQAAAKRYENTLPDGNVIWAPINGVDREFSTIAEMQAAALSEGWNVHDVELALLRATHPQNVGPAIHSGNGRDGDRETLECALALHVNSHMAEAMYDDRTLEAASTGGITCLMDVAKICAQQSGMGFNATNKTSVLEAAFSTAMYSTIMSNVANKSALMGYKSFPSVWPIVAKILDAKDFKLHTGVRLTGDSIFEETGNHADIKHGYLDDDSYTYIIGTVSKMFGISRQDMINDDSGALDGIPTKLGRGAALKINKDFWALVIANANNFFSVANGNYTTTGFGYAGLSELAKVMMEQTDTDGESISVLPEFLVLPPALKSEGDALYRSNSVYAGGGDPSTDPKVPSKNIHEGNYRPMVSPWIGAKGLEGGSDAGYYLFGNPADVAAFGVAFLDKKITPTIEQIDMAPNRLGVNWRGYIDFGVCQIDHRGAAFSLGDDSSL